jgi:16S rRNA (cytosine967-C5)-methyltransferase
VDVREADAADPQALATAVQDVAQDGFDRILLDVPCTNTGVLRRRVDARWRFNQEHLDLAVDSQRRLLDAAAAHLRPGGSMVYSTCSLEPEENELQVAQWLDRHPKFTVERRVSLFPPDSGTDGAYAALLRS